jgi:glycosyltransferase involved in cell wall biosynthesis
LKILLLVGTLNTGGLERQAANLCAYLKNNPSLHTHADVLCLWKKEGDLIPDLARLGVKIYEAPPNWRNSFQGWSALRKMFRNELSDYDVVHSFVNYSIFQQVAASWSPGKRIICFTERNAYPFTSVQRLNRMIQERLARRMGVRFSANSQQVALHLSQKLGIAKERYAVIPNGVVLPQEQAIDVDSERKELGFQQGDIIVLYTARFAAHKGQERMLRVMLQLKQHCPHLKVVFAGEGPMRVQMEALCRTFELHECVLFVGKTLQLSKWLKISDLCCLFSDYEGMPNAILEAMAFLLPVLATPTGDLPQLLTPNQLLVLPFNEVEAVDKLKELYSSANLRKKLGAKNRALVEEKHSFEAQWQQLKNFYA